MSSEVTDARSDILWVILWAANPGVSVGTTKPRMPPFSSPALAQTTATSAIEPLVIHIFEPLSTQSSPSRRARVRIDAGVGAVVGLGEAEAADRLARRHPRQPLLLLLLGAEPPDREHREAALHRHQRADAGVARLELEAGQAVVDRRHARAAVALEVHAEQADLAELAGELAAPAGRRPRTSP